LIEQPPVSVIICAKDEADNLRKFLPFVLQQDYPDFEVIVINDGSTDETDNITQ
jgi:glycosyltransferase involved in cell wall biosynthesis